MKRPILRPSIALIACLSITVWPSLLQAQSAATGFAGAGGGMASQTAPERRFDLSLDEPTAKTLCETLAGIVSTEEDPVNIVVAKDAEAIALPSMKLRKVTLSQFASFLNRLGETHPERRFQLIDNQGIWYFYAEPEGEPREQEETHVMQLTDPESALSLIEASLRLSEREDGPVLEFHEASQSLVAHGQPSDLDLIRSIVSNLSKKDEAEEIVRLKKVAHQQAAEFEDRLARERAQFERALKTNQELESRIARLMEEVDILNLKLAQEKASN